MEKIKFRLLKENEIDVRVGSVGKNGYSLLLYKNARVDMQLLDETAGIEKWQRKHYELKGNIYCSVGIRFEDEWVWKDDCGAESYSDKEKGEASDSFKRACFNWGIGRELYTAPFIFINGGTKFEDGKYKLDSFANFKVSKINYIASSIKELTIVNAKTNEVVFDMKSGYSRQEIKKEPLPEKLEEVVVEKTFVNAGDYELPFGKYKGMSLKQIYIENAGYLDWLSGAEKISIGTKKVVKEFLDDVANGYDVNLQDLGQVDSDLPF